jgi:serine/threonine-protein kinase/endoribonuclease IRE1
MHAIFYLAHLLALCLPFLLYLNASPAPDPYPAVVSLPARTKSYSHARAQPQPTPDVEHDLLPFVIVSTIDGSLHAVDRENGEVKWTLSDDVDPLVGGGIRGKGVEEEYIVEPLSGDLYVFDDEEERDLDGAPKIRKLPLSVDQL